MKKIKLFACDIGGTLTDGTVFYSKKREELKQFSHRDGRGFYLLRQNSKCKTAWVTSEGPDSINNSRASKLKLLGTLDYFCHSVQGVEKLNAIKEICEKEGIELDEVAYIGDDTNDFEVLHAVGIAACPWDAVPEIKKHFKTHIMQNIGGRGVVREFIDFLFKESLLFIKGVINEISNN